MIITKTIFFMKSFHSLQFVHFFCLILSHGFFLRISGTQEITSMNMEVERDAMFMKMRKCWGQCFCIQSYLSHESGCPIDGCTCDQRLPVIFARMAENVSLQFISKFARKEEFDYEFEEQASFKPRTEEERAVFQSWCNAYDEDVHNVFLHMKDSPKTLAMCMVASRVAWKELLKLIHQE